MASSDFTSRPLDPLRIFRVGELSSYLKELLESNDNLYDCWVAGEISNARQTVSGHYFFTIKERNAQIRCALFRQKAIWQTVLPTNGAAILAHGYVSIYETSGDLQFYVDTLQEEGKGALFLAFEQLKVELEAQGLFADERKRQVPAMPKRIGVVSSPQAAALQDILTVLARRFPLAEVIFAPSQVQGAGAARQIASAIAALNTLTDDEAVDVIIVARGGGSIEELWAFNEEVVARAIYASKSPVISGVGHETDFTITDLVADLRAPTPSVAAELAVPDINELAASVEYMRGLMLADMQGRLAVAWDEITTERLQLERLSPVARVRNDKERVATLRSSLGLHLMHKLDIDAERLRGTLDRLEALSPLQILKRGYAIVRDRQNGEIITSSRTVSPGAEYEVRVSDGAFIVIASSGQ